MTTEQKIINYLNAVSGGVIKLNLLNASKIVAIVKEHIPRGAYVKLSRFNGTKNAYEPICSQPVTDEAIAAAIAAALNGRQVNECYMYECYNSEQQFEGNIYTVNPDLFNPLLCNTHC